ncbi:hypothetical protein AWB71_05762 [Caballeronia peredens]|nr:hypothetical protein AWB71_05762 [Caballeronia peredens]
MARLQPVARRADRQFGDRAARLVHEGIRHRTGEQREALIVDGVAGCLARGEPGFGEMHQRILQRRFERRAEILSERGVQEIAAARKARLDEPRRCIEQRKGVRRAAALRVMRAREHHECVRVQVLLALERRTGRIHAIEPSAVSLVLKIVSQRFEQRRGMRQIARFREHEQLPRAGHRAVTLRRQRRVIARRDGLERQAERRVEARAAPDGQYDLRVVFAQRRSGHGRRGGFRARRLHRRRSV